MATISGYHVLVGNLIVDFYYVTMAKVLLVPNEKVRDKVYQALQENLITIRRELDTGLARDDPWDPLPEKLLEALGELGW